MTRMRLVIRGETYITLDVVAECYGCEIEWVEHVYRLGLLGAGEQVEGTAAIPSYMLERVAELMRLCHHHGIDPAVVDLLLEEL